MEALYPGGLLALPREAALRLLGAGDGDAALCYFALLSGEEKRLSWTNARWQEAHAKLVTLGLADPAAPSQLPREEKLLPDEPPQYGREDVATQLSAKGGFSALVSEIERRFGKRLSETDLRSLLEIYD